MRKYSSYISDLQCKRQLNKKRRDRPIQICSVLLWENWFITCFYLNEVSSVEFFKDFMDFSWLFQRFYAVLARNSIRTSFPMISPWKTIKIHQIYEWEHHIFYFRNQSWLKTIKPVNLLSTAMFWIGLVEIDITITNISCW